MISCFPWHKLEFICSISLGHLIMHTHSEDIRDIVNYHQVSPGFILPSYFFSNFRVFHDFILYVCFCLFGGFLFVFVIVAVTSVIDS